MELEWNEDKAKRSQEKHGVTFDEAKTVFDDPVYLILPDPDHSIGEERFIIINKSTQNRLLVVYYTEPDQITRLIRKNSNSHLKVKYMNQKYNSESEDELREEYDFNSLPVIATGIGRKNPNRVTIDVLIKEIEQTPDYLLTEILNFVTFIKNKYLEEKLEISIVSESSLVKDWLKPEEDEAWKDL